MRLWAVLIQLNLWVSCIHKDLNIIRRFRMLFSHICSGIWWKTAQINTSMQYWFLRTTKDPTKQHQVQTSRNEKADGKLMCMWSHFKGYATKLMRKKSYRPSQQTVQHSQLTNTWPFHKCHIITTTPLYDWNNLDLKRYRWHLQMTWRALHVKVPVVFVYLTSEHHMSIGGGKKTLEHIHFTQTNIHLPSLSSGQF